MSFQENNWNLLIGLRLTNSVLYFSLSSKEILMLTYAKWKWQYNSNYNAINYLIYLFFVGIDCYVLQWWRIIYQKWCIKILHQILQFVTPWIKSKNFTFWSLSYSCWLNFVISVCSPRAAWSLQTWNRKRAYLIMNEEMSWTSYICDDKKELDNC